ncbi:MAG: hypothetical protein HY319_10785 [Armatimonadetes bacterium]|nr:hypothetical protein [Armatimonadota bacterium]
MPNSLGVGELDKIETNFRLSLISQREQSVLLKEVASSLRDFGSQMQERLETLAAKVETVADKSDKTAERLEDSIEVMKSFAEGQVEMRKTLAECVRRLDALEGKKAS